MGLTRLFRHAAKTVGRRIRLATKRDHIVTEIKCADARGNDSIYRVGFGTDRSGHVREVFCSDGKSGSDRQALLHDGCILLSLALQYGASIKDIAHSMSELTDEDSGSRPASPLGAIAWAGVVIEEDRGGTHA